MAPNAGARTTAERIRPGDVDSLLASSADLVETDRRDRADQREAGREGKHQRQQVIAERQPCQEQARDGIDDAQEHHVRAVRREVADTFGQDVFQIGQVDAADPRERGVPGGAVAGRDPRVPRPGWPSSADPRSTRPDCECDRYWPCSLSPELVRESWADAYRLLVANDAKPTRRRGLRPHRATESCPIMNGAPRGIVRQPTDTPVSEHGSVNAKRPAPRWRSEGSGKFAGISAIRRTDRRGRALSSAGKRAVTGTSGEPPPGTAANRLSRGARADITCA